LEQCLSCCSCHGLHGLLAQNLTVRIKLAVPSFLYVDAKCTVGIKLAVPSFLYMEAKSGLFRI
jgi:hypothetical protein